MIGICDTCGVDVPLYTRYPEYISCGPCEERHQMGLAIQYYGDRNDWNSAAMRLAIEYDGDTELLAYFDSTPMGSSI